MQEQEFEYKIIRAALDCFGDKSALNYFIALAQQHQEAVAPARELEAEVQLLIRERAGIVHDLLADELDEPGPFAEGKERQRQQLQLDYFAMKQRAEAAEQELAVVGAARRTTADELPPDGEHVAVWWDEDEAPEIRYYDHGGEHWVSSTGSFARRSALPKWAPLPPKTPAAPPLEREAAAFSTCIHECGAPAVHDGHCACYLLGASDEADRHESPEIIGFYETTGCPVREGDDYVTDVEGCYLTRAEAEALLADEQAQQQAGAAPLEGSSPAKASVPVIQELCPAYRQTMGCFCAKGTCALAEEEAAGSPASEKGDRTDG